MFLLSYGVGRTGAYCLLHTMYHQIEREKSVSIYQIARLYNHQRPRCVSTLVRTWNRSFFFFFFTKVPEKVGYFTSYSMLGWKPDVLWESAIANVFKRLLARGPREYLSDRGSSHFLAEITSLSLLLTLICNRLKNANLVRLHQQFNTKILLDGSWF